MTEKKLSGAVAQLCPNCGLCCDSTLFADVELRAGDDEKRLAALGLVIGKKGKNKTAFAQPCACFDGKFCNIYRERPVRCRTFECGLLKKVCADELGAAEALERISAAKILAAKVRKLLRAAGQDERLALAKQYALAMDEPIDLSAEKNDSEARGELMLAVNDLMRLLQSGFLK